LNTKMGVMLHTSVPEIMEIMLDGEYWSAIELETKTGLDNSGIQRVLKNLRSYGIVDRRQDKRWALTVRGMHVGAAIVQCKDELEAWL